MPNRSDKKTLMKHIPAILTCIFLSSAIFATDFSGKDKFRSEYAHIVNLVEQDAWDKLKQYETEMTKCGFGPNQDGLGCIKNLMQNSPSCKTEILFALKQGCHIVKGKEQIECVSPPQFLNSSVVMPNTARVSFSYNIASEKLSINYFICGGD